MRIWPGSKARRLGNRRSEEGLRALAAIVCPFGYTGMPVRVHGCLHFKSGHTALDEETLLGNRAWVETGAYSGRVDDAIS
jgi:dimethylargininase